MINRYPLIKKIQNNYNVDLHNTKSKKLYKLNKIIPSIILKFYRIIKTVSNNESKILVIKKRNMIKIKYRLAIIQ